ncbi:MAG: ATP-binding protein [Caldilineaceae bacterium]
MPTKSRPTIGFLTVESSNAFSHQLWRDFVNAAEQYDINLITYAGNMWPETTEKQFNLQGVAIFDLVEPGHLDGLIVWTSGILHDHEDVEEFLARFAGIPLVSVGIKTDQGPSVVLDNYSGMHQQIDYLIEVHGHRNIAFLAGPEGNFDAQIRFRAYVDSLREHDIAFDPRMVVQCNWGWECRTLGGRAVTELLDNRQMAVDAIIGASDELAIGAMEELYRRGARLPDDIALAGFDDIEECMLVWPHLSTVRQPTEHVASAAVKLMLDLLAGKNHKAVVTIPTLPVFRQSKGWSDSSQESGPLSSSMIAATILSSQPTSPVDAHAVQTFVAAQRHHLQGKLEQQIYQEPCAYSPVEVEPWINQIMDAFERELICKQSGAVIRLLKQAIYPKLNDANALQKWKLLAEQFFTSFFDAALQASEEELSAAARKQLLLFCNELRHQVQVMMTEASIQLLRRQQIESQQATRNLHGLSRRLLSPFDSDQISEIFANELPRLQIDVGYVALYDSFTRPTKQVRLLVAYDKERQIVPVAADQRLSAAALAAGQSILGDKRMNLIVAPLYTVRGHLGFTVFSVGPRDHVFYTQLSSSLGHSIQNELLLDQVRKHAIELEQRVEERTADLRNANQLLIFAKERAEAAAIAKSQFLATVSHEIRTPMNGVIGITNLLRETPLRSDQMEFVETIRQSSESLLTILNDILDFSKIESGKLTLEQAPFQVKECFRDVINLVAPLARAKNIKLTSQFTDKVPSVLVGDVTRLRQVAMNLLTNAVKFTEKGYVALEVDAQMQTDGDCILYVSVTDTGIGIAPNKLSNMFQPFTQADSSISRRFGGTGLGLAISKRLCELMHGQLWATSKLGAGSSFIFTIRGEIPTTPLNELSMTQNSHEEAVQTQTLRPLSILLVEDNLVNQKVAKHVLERLGYCADVANNGLEAVAAVQRKSYDVILMDVQMPEMDGLEATRRIRHMSLISQPKIVAMTAGAFEEDRRNSQMAGMDDFVTKPVRAKDLASAILRVTSTELMMAVA